MKKNYELNLCTGPLFPMILRFSLPVLCSGVLQLLFNAADVVVVGRFAGSSALAAVGSTTSLILLIVNFFMGISVGVNVLIARFFGGKEEKEAQETLQTALITGLVVGIFLTLLGIAVAKPTLLLMGTPENVLSQAVLYMRIYFLGVTGTLIFNFCAAALRAVGNTKHPLYYLCVAGIVNVCINLFLVIVLKMGVAGVATATAISQFLSAALILRYLSRTQGICHVDFHRIHFYPTKLKWMLQTGLPAGIQAVFFNLSNVLIQSAVNSFGATIMAGNTAASNLDGFIYIAMNSLYQTCLSFTSQNYGAHKFKRIDRILFQCTLSVLVLGLIMGNGIYFFGRQLLGIYSSDSEVIYYGMVRLSIVAVTYALCGVMEVVCGSVRGLGYSLLPTFVSLTGACIFRIIWVYTVFQHFHTLRVLYYAWPASWVVTVAAHFICYAIIRRKQFDMKNYAETG